MAHKQFQNNEDNLAQPSSNKSDSPIEKSNKCKENTRNKYQNGQF